MNPILILTLISSLGSTPDTLGDRKTSLLDATLSSGSVALIAIGGFFVYEIESRDDASYGQMWGFFKRGFTHWPVWDNNPWYINYIGHPITGSETYLLARNRDYHPSLAFLYSSVMSVVWEYGIESWIGARPSIQDLFFTSTLGAILGEIRFIIKRSLINNEDLLSKIAVVILDPQDAIYRVIEN